jgi:protein-tyrosine-phosphatase
MNDRIYNVLFLCNANSARGIMAEAILNREGAGRFQAFSAGSHPSGKLNEDAVALLRKLNYDTASLHSKGWDEFTAPNSPQMDFVFTLCDTAAGPALPGQPMTAHWGVPDPAKIEEQGAARGLRLAEIFRMLDRRISIFVNLRLEALGRLALQSHLDSIGDGKG